MVGGSGEWSSSSGLVTYSDVSNKSWRKSMNAQIHRWVEERAALAAGGRGSLSAGSLAAQIMHRRLLEPRLTGSKRVPQLWPPSR
jgi:hypothetical protein